MPRNQLLYGKQISQALLVSAENLDLNKYILDNLNVFPVPDGDTGSNMAGTFVPAVQLLESNDIHSYQDIAEVILPYMINNSRGNSGFILSSFFKGFFSTIQSKESLSSQSLAEGFNNGFYEVNSSLLNPLAGTMVTIIEVMAISLNKNINHAVIETLTLAIADARDVLFETPKMLPILAKAGVIDSGALGFILIIEGLLWGLTDSIPKREEEKDYRFTPDPSAMDSIQTSNQGNQFCTEISVDKTKKTRPSEIKDYLSTMGDSIALIDDADRIKLHIHTNHPEKIIEKMKQYGKITREKVEDMFQQISLAALNIESENCSIVAFSPGPGFNHILEEMGIEQIIQYASKLPSLGEIIHAVEQMSASNIIFLPNNNNILPACMAVKAKSDKNITIIPTANIVEGLTCTYGFSENEDMATNITTMKEYQHLAKAVFLYKSADNRAFGDRNLTMGDYFCIHDKDIRSQNKNYLEAIAEALRLFDLSEIGNITFFYNKEDYLPKLEVFKEQLLAEQNHLEIELLWGGQAQSELIVSLE